MPQLERLVTERLDREPERLSDARARALRGLASEDGFVTIDLGWLFPAELGEALRAAMLEDLADASEVLLRVDRNRYRRPRKMSLHPGHQDLFRGYFDWTHDVLLEAAREDQGGAPLQGESTFEVRAVGPGSAGEPATEQWHRDGTIFSAILTLSGPTTLVAPNGRFIREENTFAVDCDTLVAPGPTELLVMSGGARPAARGQPATIHRPAKTTEPQLVLVTSFYGRE